MAKNMEKMGCLFLVTGTNFKDNLLMIILKKELILLREVYNIKDFSKITKKMDKDY